MTSLANTFPLSTSGGPLIQSIGVIGSSAKPDPLSTQETSGGVTPPLLPDRDVPGSTPPGNTPSPVTPFLGEAEEGGVNDDVGEDGDRVTISPEARVLGEQALAGQERDAVASVTVTEKNPETDKAKKGEEAAKTDEKAEKQEAPDKLDESEKDQVKRLKARDREVRAHEQAHITAAGGLAKGPAKFDFQRGPDEKQYAVGGHVDIDVSSIPNNPEATIARADRVKRAALAPAEPSGADRQVAARANKMKLDAQKEMMEQQQTLSEEGGPGKIGETGGREKTSPASAGEGQATEEQEKPLLPKSTSTYNILGRNNSGSIPSMGLSVTA